MSESSYISVAEDILSEMPKRTGHVNDIAEAAITRNKNFGLDYETLKTKINAALNANVKRKTGSKFARVPAKGGTAKNGPFKRGVYRLKISRASNQLPLEFGETKDRTFLGKGGEYAVASELMFRDYNVSLMVVDKGIDLVAEKDNKYFNIQVKTASENNNSWGFTIKNESFHSSLGGQTYYAFVAREQASNVFFIVPSSQIETWLHIGVLANSKTSISVKITKRDNGKKWVINNTDVTNFVRAFHVIK